MHYHQQRLTMNYARLKMQSIDLLYMMQQLVHYDVVVQAMDKRYICESGKYAAGLKPALTLSHCLPTVKSDMECTD